MSAGAKRPLAQAEHVATAIVDALRPACERIEIAGSIRRRQPMIGDVEIVLVPRMVDGPRVSLFGDVPKASALDDVLERLRVEGRLVEHPERPACGPRYKRLWAARASMQVDLFLVLPPAQWGVIYLIRTGPAGFSKRAVEYIARAGMRCEDGQIWKGSQRIACPDEETFCKLAGLGWYPPEHRL